MSAPGPGKEPSGDGLTCRRWLLTRCMLSAGLLGRILPQPRTVHRMLVRTARDSSLTDGWISSRAGGAGPAGCCLVAACRGRLPLSRPGGPQRSEAAAAPFSAAGTAGAPEARAACPAAAASEAAMAPTQQPSRPHRPRLTPLPLPAGGGAAGSLASGRAAIAAAPPAGIEGRVCGEPSPGEADRLQNLADPYEQVERTGSVGPFFAFLETCSRAIIG